MINIIKWGDAVLAEVFLKDASRLIKNLLNEFDANKHKVTKSHKIGGRWENQYLDIDDLPSARPPMRYARDLGKEKLGISSLILFDSPSWSLNPNPPFWFNIAGTGKITGLHDHAHLAALSAVFYLQADERSGDLYFRKEGMADLHIRPQVGKMVIFAPNLLHGVHSNKSGKDRISFAFNLFPFPLMQPEI